MRTPKLGRVAVAGAVAMTVGATAACGTASQDSQQNGGPPADRTVVVVYANSINTLDPQASNYAQTNTIDSLVYDSLVTYNSKNQLVGDLATQFKLLPGATSVAITLRTGIEFHDGAPVTASDVAFSLDRYKKIGQGIAGVLSDYKSTTVQDATHLTINLTEPDATFLSKLSKAYILNAKLVESHAGTDDAQSWLQTNDAGSGPYELTGSPVSGDIRVTRFGKYWDFNPNRPGSMLFKRIDESPTEYSELMTGQADIALNLAPADAARISGDKVKVAYLTPAVQTYIVANTRFGATANLAVRQALRLAYDYSGGFTSILKGKGSIANGVLPPTLSCRVTVPASTQNLGEAKAILSAAGIRNLTLTLDYQPTNFVQTQEATLFQSDLKQIGVTVDLEPIAYADYLTLLTQPSKIPELMLENAQAQVPDPGVVLDSTYRSTAIGTNLSAYDNKTVDQLLAKADATTSSQARCDLYEQAQKLIYDDAVTVNMYGVAYPVGYASDISGVVTSTLVNPVDLADITVG